MDIFGLEAGTINSASSIRFTLYSGRTSGATTNGSYFAQGHVLHYTLFSISLCQCTLQLTGFVHRLKIFQLHF